MKFLHAMVRVKDLEESLNFYKDVIGLTETRRKVKRKERCTLVFLGTDPNKECLELTFNWDKIDHYSYGGNFGHLCFVVDNIYEFCQMLLEKKVNLIRPPVDGWIAFILSPDNIAIEIVQKNAPLQIIEPWASMPVDEKGMLLIKRIPDF